MNVDPVLERYGPPPTAPLPGWVGDARRTLTTAAGGVLSLDEPELNRRWRWREDHEGDTEVRYAFYRASRRSSGRRATPRPLSTPPAHARLGAPPFGHATAARWDLHGLLAPLADDDLDADRAAASGRSARRSPTSCTSSARTRRTARGGCRASRRLSCRRASPMRSTRGSPRRRRRASAHWRDSPAPGRRDGRRGGADGCPRRAAARDAGTMVRLRGRRRLPAGADVLAPPGAHRPGREDTRHARNERRRRRIGSSGWCSGPTVASRRPCTACRPAMADAGREPLVAAVARRPTRSTTCAARIGDRFRRGVIARSRLVGFGVHEHRARLRHRRRPDGPRHRPGQRRGRQAGDALRPHRRAGREGRGPHRRQPQAAGRQGQARAAGGATRSSAASAPPKGPMRPPATTSSSRRCSRTRRSSARRGGRAEQAADAEAIFASNTSSISITGLATATDRAGEVHRPPLLLAGAGHGADRDHPRPGDR